MEVLIGRPFVERWRVWIFTSWMGVSCCANPARCTSKGHTINIKMRVDCTHSVCAASGRPGTRRTMFSMCVCVVFTREWRYILSPIQQQQQAATSCLTTLRQRPQCDALMHIAWTLCLWKHIHTASKQTSKRTIEGCHSGCEWQVAGRWWGRGMRIFVLQKHKRLAS